LNKLRVLRRLARLITEAHRMKTSTIFFDEDAADIEEMLEKINEQYAGLVDDYLANQYLQHNYRNNPKRRAS
jgi:hypothetical protein